MTLKNNRAPLLCYVKLCATFESHWWIHIKVTVRKRPIWVRIGVFLSCMILKVDWWPWKNRTSLLCFAKLCASFRSHQWIQTGVTVRKCSVRVEIGEFLVRVILKFDGWSWKTIGHFFYATSRFAHHFIGISESKLELQSGNALFGLIFFFVPCDLEIWCITMKKKPGIGHLFYVTPSFVHHFVAIGEFKLELQSGNARFGWKSVFFVPRDLEIRRMTLKNKRAPLLRHIKLCASFRSHLWIQTGVAVRKRSIWVKIGISCRVWPWNLTDDLEKQEGASRICYFKICASFHSQRWIQTEITVCKRPIWVKIDDLLSRVTLKFDGWPWKTRGASPMPHQALCIISSPYVNSNSSYGPETAKLCPDLCDLDCAQCFTLITYSVRKRGACVVVFICKVPNVMICCINCCYKAVISQLMNWYDAWNCP